MAILQNQGTLLYTPTGGTQQSLNSNITQTEVSVTYGIAVFHGVTPDTFLVGDTVSYTVVLQNTESGSLYTPNVTVNVTGGTLDYVAGSVTAYLLTGSAVTAVPVTVTATDPLTLLVDAVIPAGGLVYIDYQAVVTAATADEIVSTAIGGANAGSPTGAIVSDSDTATITRATLAIVKTAPETASVGDTINYQFTITNSAAEAISFDCLTDQLPEGFTFTGATLTVGGVSVPLVAGVDYTVTDGLFLLDPATPVSVPGGTAAILTLTGVVTA